MGVPGVPAAPSSRWWRRRPATRRSSSGRGSSCCRSSRAPEFTQDSAHLRDPKEVVIAEALDAFLSVQLARCSVAVALVPAASRVRHLQPLRVAFERRDTNRWGRIAHRPLACHHEGHTALHGRWREGVVGSAVASDDRPAGGRAHRRAEHDVAEEVHVVVQARRADVGGDREGRQRQTIAKMSFDDRRQRESVAAA